MSLLDLQFVKDPRSPRVRVSLRSEGTSRQPLIDFGMPVFVTLDSVQVQRETSDESMSMVEAMWDHPVATGRVRVETLRHGSLRVTHQAQITQPFVSAGIEVPLQLHLSSPHLLTNDFRWKVLTAEQSGHRLTPVAIGGATHDQRHTMSCQVNAGLAAHHWTWNEPAGVVTGRLLWDHPLSHPRFTFEGPQFRNWHNAYTFQTGHSFTMQIDCRVTNEPEPILVLGRYPGRCRAVFSITDHADHDSCERLAALWYGTSRCQTQAAKDDCREGFVGLKLPFTKSVFTATPDPHGPGLHDERFRELCREGHRAGIEICPHGIHSTTQPEVDEIAALLDPFLEFSPRTWIDHGNRFLSNYGRRGWDPSDEYSLHPWLDRLGIKYLWGRIDFGQAIPRGHLDQSAVSRFRGLAYLQDFPRHSQRSLVARRPWAVLHSLSSLAFQLIPEKAMLQYFWAQRSIQRVMRADLRAVPGALWQTAKMAAAVGLPPGVLDVYRHLTGPREEITYVPIFFPEHYSWTQGERDRWLFNTLSVHDVAYAYSPPVVEQLLDDYGIHLSHTYLTSVSSAHVSHAIEPAGDGHWRLTEAFDRNLKHLAGLHSEGRLWVASMGEIGDFWSRQSQVVCSRESARKWHLQPPDVDERPCAEQQVVVVGDCRRLLVNGSPVALEPLHRDSKVQVAAVVAMPGERLEIHVE